jgi:hypothetical protein
MIAGHRVSIPADDQPTVQILVYPLLLVLHAETASCGGLLGAVADGRPVQAKASAGQHNRRTICDGAGRQIGENGCYLADR